MAKRLFNLITRIFDGYLQGAQSSVAEDNFGAIEKMEKMMA